MLYKKAYLISNIKKMKTKKVPQNNFNVIKMRDEERRSWKETPKKDINNPSLKCHNLKVFNIRKFSQK